MGLSSVTADMEIFAREVVDSAFSVHSTLGPGLLESVYEECLAIEFTRRSIEFGRQITLPANYRGHIIENAYRVDMIVEGCIILELKAVDALLPVHKAQLLSYLRACLTISPPSVRKLSLLTASYYLPTGGYPMPLTVCN